MGLVYAAYDPQLDRRVAIKVPRPAGSQLDVEEQARLVREAKAMAQLRHPNVVAVHDLGVTDEGEVWIAMELVEGETATAWLSKRSRRWPAVLDTILQAGRGLRAVHAAGLLHRDFKLTNVMIEPSDAGPRARVLDFGLARRRATVSSAASQEDLPVLGGDASMTRTGALVGTPAYMAPEQLDGVQATELSDQFAFCVAAWEALSGARPFAGETISALHAAIVEGAVRPSRGAGMPRWLRRILRRGLSADPKDRWPSMGRLIDALRNGNKRHRRRLLGAVGVVGALGLIATFSGFQLRRTRALGACESRRQAVMSIWEGAKRTAIREQFLGGEAAFARGGWETVDANLAKYVQDVANRTQTACVGAVMNDVEPALTSRVETCIEVRRIAVEELVAVLEVSGPRAAVYGVQSSLELPPTRDCDDPPKLNSAMLRAPAARARTTLARGSALWHMGNVDAALEATELALEESEFLPYLKLEALLRRGQYLWSRRSEDAVSSLQEAYRRAARIGHTRYAFSVATELAMRMLESGQPEAAAVWSHVMGAGLERLEAETGQPQWGLRSRVARIKGALASSAGDLDGAVLRAEEAVHSERYLADQSPGLAQALQALAHAHAEQLQMATALRAAEEALAIATDIYGVGNPRLAAYSSTIGTLTSLSGKPGEARTAFLTAIKLTESAGEPTVIQAMAHLGLSRLELHAGALPSAKSHASTAANIVDEVLGRPNERVAAIEAALTTIALQEGDLEQALRHAHAKLELDLDLLGAGHPSVASSRSVVATVCASMEDWGCARIQYEKALSVYGLLPGSERANDVYARLGLCEVVLAQGDAMGAERHARDAIEGRRFVSPETRELPEENAVLVIHPP